MQLFSLITIIQLSFLFNLTNCLPSVAKAEQKISQVEQSKSQNVTIDRLIEYLNSTKVEIAELRSKISELSKPKSWNAITHPKAIVYDSKGNIRKFNWERKDNPKCLHLVNFTVKSLDTFGSCVRLSTWNDCRENSRAYYPGSSNQTILDGVKSIGPCIDNEFDMSFTKWNENGTNISFIKIKNEYGLPHIPDQLSIGKHYPSKSSVYPIVDYKLGLMNKRVEFLRVEYLNEKNRLNNNNNPSFPHQKDTEFYEKLEKKPEDISGQFVTSILGASDSFHPNFHNVFPQDIWNKKKQEEIEKMIISTVNKVPYDFAIIFIDVDYLNSTSTRPIGFNMFINFGKQLWKDYYLSNLIGDGYNVEE